VDAPVDDFGIGQSLTLEREGGREGGRGEGEGEVEASGGGLGLGQTFPVKKGGKEERWVIRQERRGWHIEGGGKGGLTFK